MMKKLDAHKTGLTLGAVLALIHAAWLLFVLIAPQGVQKFLTWVLGLHHIAMGFQILPFHPLSALLLLAVTFAFGYLLGQVFARIWNSVY